MLASVSNFITIGSYDIVAGYAESFGVICIRFS